MQAGGVQISFEILSPLILSLIITNAIFCHIFMTLIYQIKKKSLKVMLWRRDTALCCIFLVCLRAESCQL